MKILHFSERSAIPQDVYESERLLIVNSYNDLSDHQQLHQLLQSWRKFNDFDMFNLHLWIDVLNILDKAMHDLLQVFKDTRLSQYSASNRIVKDHDINDDDADDDRNSSNDGATYRVTLQVILTWSTEFLKHSFNTNIYRSLDVSTH